MQSFLDVTSSSSKSSTPSLTSTAASAGTALSGAAGLSGLATFGIGTAISVIGGIFLAAHTARLKGAQDENAALNEAVPAWDKDMQFVFDEANAGHINAAQAKDYLTQIDANFSGYIKQFNGRAGINWSGLNNWPNNLTEPEKEGGSHCDKNCTAGCCTYGNMVHPAVLNAIWVMDHPGNSAKVIAYTPNPKYSTYSRGAYRLAYNPPVQTSVASGIVQATQQAGSVLQSLGLGTSSTTTNPSGQLQTQVQSDRTTVVYVALGAVGFIVLLFALMGFSRR